MASPTVRRQRHSSPSMRSVRFRLHVGRLPLVLRRFTAWSLEVSFVAISAIAPYQVGLLVDEHYDGQRVPLNPMVAVAEETIGRTLAIPIGQRHHAVAPLTNLFWSIAVLAPLVVAGSQLYLLSQTGQTLPKRWMKLRVVTATGEPPGLTGILMREGVGRCGIPLGLAYLIWRYSGAFPGLGILGGLSGLFLFGESLSGQVRRQRRPFHDQLAGTYVLDLTRGRPSVQTVSQTRPHRPTPVRVETAEVIADQDGAVTAIVLTPRSSWWGRQSLWGWMRRHPGLTLVTAGLAGIALVLGTFVGTQVYIQTQANWREGQAQNDRLLMALVDKLSPSSRNPIEEKRAAILTLGTIQDSRAMPLLVDLLAQENEPSLIEALQQALVTTGPQALEPLGRLNQALTTDIESLSGNEKTTALLRRRATQRAIAKIITLYSGQVHGVDLNRIHLGQLQEQPAPFTLVLDQADLGGIKLRSALLAGASLRGTQFYSAGEDGRLGTYDDWVADLSGTEMKESDLSDAVLPYVVLNRTNLVRAILDRANLYRAQMIGANFSSARLIKTNLQQAVLEEASFTGADLGEANLSHANLREARMGEVSAIGTNFQSANLSQSDWQGADLTSANLQDANLRSANFRGARLAGTNFANAQLQNASFRGADLSGMNLKGANLNNADFQGAIFATPEPAQNGGFIALAPEVDKVGYLIGVNFNSAKNLDEQQLNYICAQGGIHDYCKGEKPDLAPQQSPPSAAPVQE